MSSLRNAVQRRNHRERAQPVEREKWGILEKHKDYSARAKDYGKKKAKLRTLRQKAAERNPDEFHYAMLSSSTDRGRKIGDRANPILSQEAVKVLKTQDLAYVQTILQNTRRAISRLQERLMIETDNNSEGLRVHHVSSRSDHIIFTESESTQRRRALEHYDSQRPVAAQNIGVSTSKADTLGFDATQTGLVEDHAETEDAQQRVRRRTNEVKCTELKMLQARAEEMQVVESSLQQQRSKMTNSGSGMTSAGLRWKQRQRKG